MAIIAGLFIIFFGLLLIILHKTYFRKLIALAFFQNGVIIIFILAAYNQHKSTPFIEKIDQGLEIVNPLPHVLMLTAIVVGVAVLSVGLSLAIKLKKEQNLDLAKKNGK
jgi:multicomponent Na+:H+ antiporter subunit C